MATAEQLGVDPAYSKPLGEMGEPSDELMLLLDLVPAEPIDESIDEAHDDEAIEVNSLPVYGPHLYEVGELPFDIVGAFKGWTPKAIPESGDEKRAREQAATPQKRRGGRKPTGGTEVAKAKERHRQERIVALTGKTITDRMTGVTVSAIPVQPDEGWSEKGNCRGVDPDLFFPERGASTREAKEVCRGCEVKGDCLEFALSSGEKFGIWGGLSERERRRIRRQRAQALKTAG